MWLRSKRVQKLGGGWMEQAGLDTWSTLQMLALAARKPKEDVALLRSIRRERKCLNSAFECYTVLSLARTLRHLPGAYAEVGVYQGATARLICEAKGDKPLLLFDTFEGLPPDGEHDPGVHRDGMFACSLESVSGYLKGYEGVSYHRGVFPESTEGVAEQQYAFVHFDVDLYEGTRACLEYFYPRMVDGGIMLSHDYGMLAGVAKAFDEFLEDKPETVFEQATTQCIVIKQPAVAAIPAAAAVGEVALPR